MFLIHDEAETQMTTRTRSNRATRLALIGISCTALVAISIVPALASTRVAGSDASQAGGAATRLQLLRAETAGADGDELTQLDALIDADDGDTEQDAETTDAIDTPEATHRPQEAAPEAEVEVDEPGDANDQGEQGDANDQGDDNAQGDDDQGDQEDGDHDDVDSGTDDDGAAGEHDDGDSGGD